MVFLEKLFLFMSIIFPAFFIATSIIKWKNIRRKPKLLVRISVAVVLTFLLNYTIYTLIKNHNENENRPIEVKKINNENNNYVINDGDDITTTTKSDDVTTGKTTTTSSTTTKSTTTKETTTTKVSTTKVIKLKTSKDFDIVIKDGVTYVGGYLIVNKTYSLPESYIPKNTYKKVTSSTTICSSCLVKDAYDAFEKMRVDAKKKNITLWIQSGYRSYSYQNGLYNMYVKKDGVSKADTYSARPGYSEHQSGYALDLNNVNDSFATTKEGKWVNENAYKYGYILRYPKGKESITGYKYESWHLRYVGESLASKLYNNGDWITLEEYFGIDSKYN